MCLFTCCEANVSYLALASYKRVLLLLMLLPVLLDAIVVRHRQCQPQLNKRQLYQQCCTTVTPKKVRELLLQSHA